MGCTETMGTCTELPEFVRSFGGEAYPAAAGSFLWLCRGEAAASQDAPNSRYCTDFGEARVTGQVLGDGGRANVVTLSAQYLPSRTIASSAGEMG
jgi:hypothetical protein